MFSSKPISHLKEFQKLEKEWQVYYETDPSPSPFFSFEYAELWDGCFALPDEVLVYRAVENNRTVAFMPLSMIRKHGARFLTNLTNGHCLHSQPLVLKGQEESFQQSILRALIADSGSWDIICNNFSYSFPDLPILFPGDLLLAHNLISKTNTEPTYTIDLRKSFETYFRVDLAKSAQKNIRNCRNRLAKAGEIFCRHYMNAEALEHWPTFLDLENSGWKGIERSSIKNLPDNFKVYYQELVKQLTAKNILHLFVLEVNSCPIASGFGYVEGDTFHYAKAGYDEQYAELFPSNLLLIYIIEHLMTKSLDVKRFHIYPWDYGYKHRFINEDAVCIQTIIYSPTFRGKLVYEFSQIKNKIRNNHPEL